MINKSLGRVTYHTPTVVLFFPGRSAHRQHHLISYEVVRLCSALPRFPTPRRTAALGVAYPRETSRSIGRQKQVETVAACFYLQPYDNRLAGWLAGCGPGQTASALKKPAGDRRCSFSHPCASCQCEYVIVQVLYLGRARTSYLDPDGEDGHCETVCIVHHYHRRRGRTVLEPCLNFLSACW